MRVSRNAAALGLRRSNASARRSYGFSLVELLVVLAIVAILAAIIFPVLAQAKEKAKQSVCLSNLRQIGLSMSLYMQDYDDRLPDRRDLKLSLPGGYRPWTSWPPSDPRSGWAGVLLETYGATAEMWSCPSVRGSAFGEAVQVSQRMGFDPSDGVARYWMWQFDRAETVVGLENYWGKTIDQAVADLQTAANPFNGIPDGPSQAELAVDPYFPRTARNVDPALAGRSVHFGGRNRLFLDGSVKWMRDARLNP